MPYLSTSQEFLKQSSLLLEAYPDTARITTKYSYPKISKSSSSSRSKPSSAASPQPTTAQPQSATATATTTTAAPEPATLTLKTYHPTSGICLKYRTNKAAEIGRLIAGLGKLAAGTPIEEVVVVGESKEPASGGGNVEMVDAAPVVGASASAAVPGGGSGTVGAGSGGAGVSKSGKGKKKGGKGKR